MKLNRKLWTAALAVAMTTPSAMAAQDTAGMHYTSAAEGFYASIRLRYVSNGGDKDGGSDIQNSGSRIGVRGTRDLGSGLEGFYQYEMGVSTTDGGCKSDDASGCANTRLGLVGLRGDFGEFVAGSFWTNSYSWVYGSTDVANRHSGWMYSGLGQGRSKKSVQYSTPDLNGFRGAVLIQADSDSDGDGKVGTAKNPKDDNDIDHWNVVAAYDIAGFSTGFSFSRYPDKIMVTGVSVTVTSPSTSIATPIPDAGDGDKNSWAFKLGYSQDNWYVNGWYGKEEAGYYNDPETHAPGRYNDTEVFSLAGGVSVDKVAVYAVYENTEEERHDAAGKKRAFDLSHTTLGVQYTLGSNSWAWVEYAGRDNDKPETTEDDDFSIGLGHSF